MTSPRRVTDAAIVARNLRRVFSTGRMPFRRGGEVVAVEDISFAVPCGTIFGMLGPNGAGKTTTIKMLSTLLVPTSGTATIGGFDVQRDERDVRRQLGVVLGGDRGLYWKLSARDNLVYFGNLYGMQRDTIDRRVAELLELVNLSERANHRVEGFSRGMKQRLHLAKALLHDPPILILDEPTIGLDPASAVDLRRAIANLVPEHTVLLTTHDMWEADQLCAEIAIVDHGRIVAQGTPGELKGLVQEGRRIVVTTHESLGWRVAEMTTRLEQLAGVWTVQHEITVGGESELTILCANPARILDDTLAVVRCANVSLNAVRVLEPTLEDAFLSLAGGTLQ
ncbi:MAG TPA: ATP-binding cassette domain-containing protein [Thermomicrobiales bacterium]|nr:ATP-binding cassette domain-containing protein [Thermomicrobiales bacterium]